MGGDALQTAAVHTAMAAMAYLTNIMNGFLNAEPTQMAGPPLGLGSRLEAGLAPGWGICVTERPRLRAGQGGCIRAALCRVVAASFCTPASGGSISGGRKAPC